MDASSAERVERWLLTLAGACLVATVIFARWGLAIIRHARSRGTTAGFDDPLALAIVASWDDFTLE